MGLRPLRERLSEEKDLISGLTRSSTWFSKAWQVREARQVDKDLLSTNSSFRILADEWLEHLRGLASLFPVSDNSGLYSKTHGWQIQGMVLPLSSQPPSLR